MTAQGLVTTPMPDADAGQSDDCVLRGDAVVMFAFDVAMTIDLDRAEQLLGTLAVDVRRAQQLLGTPDAGMPAPGPPHRRRAPVRVLEPNLPMAVGTFRTTNEVECVLHDFGAVTVLYRIPIEGTLGRLTPLGVALRENTALLADSRRRIERLMRDARPALARPQLADLVEDYVVYQVTGSSPPGRAHLARPAEGEKLTQLLRAQTGPLSADEVENAISAHLAHRPTDLVLVDCNAALVVSAESEDVVRVLEHANVQLLELRHLDDRLDELLSQAYAALLSRRRWLPFRSRRELRRLARLQVDNAVLFEAVHNALKLAGDQYLARVHRLAARRFHLRDWEASVRTKLETLEAIYSKTYQRAATVRLEVLEWLIVAPPTT